MHWYLLSYFRKQRVRFGLTVAGLALALSAVFIAYGLAAWVDATSSKALSYVIDRGSLWIVPAGGVRLDRHLAAIVPSSKVPDEAIQVVRQLDPAARIRKVAVGVVQMNDRSVVLYATDSQVGASLSVSEEIWRSFGKSPTAVSLAGRSANADKMDGALPSGAVSGSFETWASALANRESGSWIVVDTDRPRLVANKLREVLAARVTDSPDALTEAGTQSPTAILLDASLSRFDPFSFRTKFSSLMLSAALSSIFGWVAKFVFGIGIVLALTSTFIGLREKRSEIGLFTALGLQSSFTLVLLAEAVVVVGAAFVLGSLISGVALSGIVPGSAYATVIAPSVVMGSIYAIAVLIVMPLVGAQQVASRSASELVREGLK